MYAHLSVAVDATLNDDTFRTEIEFFHVPVVQQFTESRHVEQRVLVVVGILFRLEFQDLTHLLVGGKQMAVLVVEGQSRKRLLEDAAILVDHLLFLLLQQDLFRAVCQCAEDVDGSDGGSVGILGNALVFHIVPLAESLLTAHVPAEDTLVGLRLTIGQALDELCVYMAVFGVDHLKAFLIVLAAVWQEVAVHIDAMPLSEIEHHHVVLAHVERVLHDGRGLFDLVNTLTDAQQADAVHGPGYHEGDAGDDHHQHR